MPDSPIQPVDNSVAVNGDAPAEESRGGTRFECPRCGLEVVSAFYGPCQACREALRTTITAEAVDVAPADYEPKMNVTPNAVATKD